MDDEILNKELREKAEALKDAILNCSEYTAYITAREQLKEKEELFHKMNEFRKRNFEMQITGESANPNAVQHLLDEKGEVLGDPLVTECMNAELILCRKLKGIYKLLTDDIDLDIDFM